MIKIEKVIILFLIGMVVLESNATEYHVSKNGNDTNMGLLNSPFKTISKAVENAFPGDTITVHQGIYREWINPIRGGDSPIKRILYRAAPNEKVVIKGSEVVSGWEKIENQIWTVTIPNTFFGEFNPFQDAIWGDWFNNEGRLHHTACVYLDGHWLREAECKEKVFESTNENPLWFSITDERETTIWAQFGDNNPNHELVEVNVRQSVFYPEKEGINYITVSGFTLEHAATPWAPPTAEQIGLIGTHWSKGWIIENNTIQYTSCVGITLGKHGDNWDNKAESAFGYNQTIERALKRGWTKENIGHHIVRNNHIHHCGQAGIVGSMGAAFSTITGNEIHDIHLDWPFSGYEMAGIKFHAPIDSEISNNHIYRCGGWGGIWLDWMTQGTRVSRNLMHDNTKDIFVEVNHGPFLIDNNLLLSSFNLLESSGGGAYVHNLFAGEIRRRSEFERETPFHKPHSTEIMALSKVVGDDERFFNNLFWNNNGLVVYDKDAINLQAEGNVYLNGALPSIHEKDALVLGSFFPKLILEEKQDGWWLELNIDIKDVRKQKCKIITTEALGKTMISKANYEYPDGSHYIIQIDYFGEKTRKNKPVPGPFSFKSEMPTKFLVWPKK